jgi:hypothetical protein
MDSILAWPPYHAEHVDNFMMGHIAKFSQNCFKEIVVEVDWANGDTFALHSAILTFEVDYEAYLNRWMKE